MIKGLRLAIIGEGHMTPKNPEVAEVILRMAWTHRAPPEDLDTIIHYIERGRSHGAPKNPEIDDIIRRMAQTGRAPSEDLDIIIRYIHLLETTHTKNIRPHIYANIMAGSV